MGGEKKEKTLLETSTAADDSKAVASCVLQWYKAKMLLLRWLV